MKTPFEKARDHAMSGALRRYGDSLGPGTYTVALPLRRERFDVIRAVAAGLKEQDTLCIRFKEPFDEVLHVQINKEADVFRPEICYDMSDFKQEPLILCSGAMELREVLEFVHTLCVEMTPTDGIPCILKWKSKN